MRLVLCVLLTLLIPRPTFAAQRTLSRSEALTAVAGGETFSA